MKKLLYTLLGIAIATAGSVYAVNVSVPQATAPGQVLVGNTNGTWSPSLSISIGTTTTTNFCIGVFCVNGISNSVASTSLDTTIPTSLAVYNAVNTKQTNLTTVAIKTSNYTANPDEDIPVDISGGSFTVTLPTAPANNTVVQVRIVTVGNSKQVTINTGAGDFFNKASGLTSINGKLLAEYYNLSYTSATKVWRVMEGALPSSFATNFTGIDATTPITNANISIDYTNRVLTITPPLGYFNIIVDGNGVSNRITKAGNIDFPAFTDTSGMWYFYFNQAGTAVTTQTAWTIDDFSTVVPVYRILWNATKSAGVAEAVAEYVEYHQNTISADVHKSFHQNVGTYWESGFTISSNAITSGTPDPDGRNAVVGITSGHNNDDNLEYIILNSSTSTAPWSQDLGSTTAASLTALTGAKFNIFSQNAGGIIEYLPATRFPFAWNSSTNLPQYITATGATTTVGASNFFSYFIYSTQNPRTGESQKIVSSPTDFSNITNARAFNWTDIQNTYPVYFAGDQDIRPMYRIIMEYRTAYNVGTKKTAIREIQDLRKAIITQSTAVTSSVPASSVTVTTIIGLISTNVQNALTEIFAYAGSFLRVVSGGLETATSTDFIRANNFIATSTTATSTFPVALTGSLFAGVMSFAPDSGLSQWIDNPVTSGSSINTYQGYSAKVDGMPMLSLYSYSDGAGSVLTPTVGFGTTTATTSQYYFQGRTSDSRDILRVSSSTDGIPYFNITSGGNYGFNTANPYAKFTLTGNSNSTGNLLGIVNSASTTLMNMLDNGTTYFAGNVGIGTTTPTTKLSVVGEILSTYFTSSSSTATSTFPKITSTFGYIETFVSNLVTAVTGYFTNLYVNNHKVYPRWTDKMSIPQVLSTDETMKFGSCLESGGPSVTIDKVDTLIASSTATGGVTWNLNIANTTSSSTPVTLFTSATTTTATSSVKTSTSGFSISTIPSGYCYWINVTSASSTIGMFYMNLFGYEN